MIKIKVIYKYLLINYLYYYYKFINLNSNCINIINNISFLLLNHKINLLYINNIIILIITILIFSSKKLKI